MKKIKLKGVEVLQTIPIEYDKKTLTGTVTRKATIFVLKDPKRIGLKLKKTALFDSFKDLEIPDVITCGIPGIRRENYPIKSVDTSETIRVIVLKGNHWFLLSRKNGNTVLVRKKKAGEKSDYSKKKNQPGIDPDKMKPVKMVHGIKHRKILDR